MNSNRFRVGRRRSTVLAAVVGASAVVALGAMTVAIDQERGSGPAVVNVSGGNMSLGNTATEAPSAETVIATSVAVPPVKATQFGES
jgi:hypothetical protein